MLMSQFPVKGNCNAACEDIVYSCVLPALWLKNDCLLSRNFYPYSLNKIVQSVLLLGQRTRLVIVYFLPLSTATLFKI